MAVWRKGRQLADRKRQGPTLWGFIANSTEPEIACASPDVDSGCLVAAGLGVIK